MKKPAIIFVFLSVYIVAAFAWWTFAHIKSNKEVHEEEIKTLELYPYKASLDIRAAVDNERFRDTTALKEYFHYNYPGLKIIFDTEYDPLTNYIIIPTEEAYTAIHKKYSRRVWMYSLEGIVMVTLLFWGIVWIYRSLQSRIKLKRQQSNFLLSITHELKTPIASIKLYLETLLKRNLEKQQSDQIIRNSLSDITRLRELVENLLAAAQLDSHGFALSFTDTDLSQLVGGILDRYATPRNLKERLQVQIEPDIRASVDSIAIEMVITNLLSNAIKYSPADKPVKVSLKKEGTAAILSVADEGQGIQGEDKKNIFGKFYRAEDENVRKTKGTGLGLFIVKNLLALHQADITMKDNKPNGAIFEITLPTYAV